MREDSTSSRLQALVTANSSMEGSLRAARADREALERENVALRSRSAAPSPPVSSTVDAAPLREAIEHIGHEISSLFAMYRLAEPEDQTARIPTGRMDPGSALGASERGELVEASRRRVARPHAADR